MSTATLTRSAQKRALNPEIRRQLVQIKDNLSQRQLEPLVRRLNDFTENKTVRHVIASQNSDIDFREVINQDRILLVDVRSGEVGNTVTELLTSIVVTKLWAAAQHRYYQETGETKPFYLFIDELQSFPMEGAQFEEILSKAREYRLGCWLATQYLAQLPRNMRDAVRNNCRTKLVFDPSGSDDISKLNRMLRNIDQEQLNGLGDFRAILQTPGTHQRNQATVFDTFPPWNPGNIDIDLLKQHGSVATDLHSPQPVFTGKGVNAGNQKHNELLRTAKEELEQRGFAVKILYQDAGDDKPDGHVKMRDGSIAHLEAEHGTLSKPGKVLENLRRAVELSRECIFIVEEGNAAKLHTIVSDPVNRRGNDHKDEQGSYTYYRIDGKPFTDVTRIRDADYRILELTEDGPHRYEHGTDYQPGPKEENLREIDRTVLNRIKNGDDDIQKITSATGLPNHKVNYSFKKLEENGFIHVDKPEEPVERVIDGQKRVFTVKTAELTSKARERV